MIGRREIINSGSNNSAAAATVDAAKTPCSRGCASAVLWC